MKNVTLALRFSHFFTQKKNLFNKLQYLFKLYDKILNLNAKVRTANSIMYLEKIHNFISRY